MKNASHVHSGGENRLAAGPRERNPKACVAKAQWLREGGQDKDRDQRPTSSAADLWLLIGFSSSSAHHHFISCLPPAREHRTGSESSLGPQPWTWDLALHQTTLRTSRAGMSTCLGEIIDMGTLCQPDWDYFKPSQYLPGKPTIALHQVTDFSSITRAALLPLLKHPGPLVGAQSSENVHWEPCWILKCTGVTEGSPCTWFMFEREALLPLSHISLGTLALWSSQLEGASSLTSSPGVLCGHLLKVSQSENVPDIRIQAARHVGNVHNWWVV